MRQQMMAAQQPNQQAPALVAHLQRQLSQPQPGGNQPNQQHNPYSHQPPPYWINCSCLLIWNLEFCLSSLSLSYSVMGFASSVCWNKDVQISKYIKFCRTPIHIQWYHHEYRSQLSWIFSLLSTLIYILMSYFHTVLFGWWPSVLGSSLVITSLQTITAVTTWKLLFLSWCI